MSIEYLGLRNLGEEIGEIPIYTDEYMPLDKLYIIGNPTPEPSRVLVDTTGEPLPVLNYRKLKRVGIINPHPAESLTVIDFSKQPSKTYPLIWFRR